MVKFRNESKRFSVSRSNIYSDTGKQRWTPSISKHKLAFTQGVRSLPFYRTVIDGASPGGVGLPEAGLLSSPDPVGQCNHLTLT